MAARVEWSPEALDDVDAIAEFIHRTSPSHAAGVVRRILDLVAEIAEFPLAGRVVPEFADAERRERFVYSYRVIYIG